MNSFKYKFSTALLLTLLLCWCEAIPLHQTEEGAQNFQLKLSANSTKEYEEEFLYIHLIPHSHDDVGWLKTVDEYYYGAQNQIQWAGVQYTIDSVVDELLKNSTRKYVQVEIAFLYRWWIDSPEARQDQMRHLIATKQIEIINGGWCMHDEATTYYEDIVDQMTVGHQWILETFGVIPTIGWHIDPFGHQASNAALFSQMGFNGWWFSRIDYQDKWKRESDSSLEMIWQPYQASGLDHSIFTAVNYNHYNPPPGYDFDILEPSSQPIMDNPRLEGYNLVNRSDEFVSYFRNMSQYFRSNHLMHTMGEDFNYASALMQYKNIDKLMNFINQHQDIYRVKLMYSTPSIYLEEIHNLNITFPTKQDDFFPYADVVDGYWTGYFTSRVAIKGSVRDKGRYLQHIRNIFSVAKITGSSNYLKEHYQEFLSHLEGYEQNMAILQHHDAVAGTEKQFVDYDYVYRLQNSTDRINEVLHPVLEEGTLKDIGESVKYSQCNWNATANECTATFNGLLSKQPVLLKIHNPTVSRNLTVRVKVPNSHFDVINSNNESVYGEVFCLNKDDSQDCDLYFLNFFSGYSSSYFKLVPNDASVSTVEIVEGNPFGFLKVSENVQVNDDITLKVTESSSNYVLKTCESGVDIRICDEHPFTVKYNRYFSYQGKGQKSGAYIFRPSSKDINGSKTYSVLEKQSIFKGKLLSIVRIEATHTIAQLKVFASKEMKNVVELETYVKSIPIEDQRGKEIVLLVNTKLNNNQTFYTDSNGLELQKRILNYRPTWNLTVNQPSSGNYYPVNGLITLTDINNKKRVSLVNDRSQGGTSLEEGQLEIMIHRRLLRDDARGVGEPLNETETYNSNIGLRQKIRHFIVFEENEKTSLARKIQNYVDTIPITFQAISEQSTFISAENPPPKINPLFNNISPFVKVYWRPFRQDYLLRLNNLNDKDVGLFLLPLGFTIIDEVTLTANQSKEAWEKKRYTWQVEGQQSSETSQKASSYDIKIDKETQVPTILLKPLELRAFIVRQKQQTETAPAKTAQNI